MLDFAIRYLNVLKTDLAGLNLTNILDQDEFYHKQILDSINPYLQSELFQKEVQKRGVVVDVGFGGGFPILPLAKLLPDIKFVGVESKRKKVDAVKLIADKLGLTNVKLVHSRLEDFIFDRPATITFKAVGTIQDYLPIINRTTSDISVFLYKGPNFMELEGDMIKKLEKDWKLLENQEIKVPGTQQRFLVSFAAQNVPRGTSKTLVKLSDFL
ncbi:RsmG family class I SAM-dependent methyltransferase [Peredibacter sp. HCB2-198]|uniref:RsmG family class I SAM-dependent methyltransferase n=1 Tax=Peredibacter sp. HCB2-198 TaxID=3383025 RepID=UPI0038B69B62